MAHERGRAGVRGGGGREGGGKGLREKKAHFPPLSGELFLRCLEKHCRYDNDCEGGSEKGRIYRIDDGRGGPRAHRHLYAAVYVHGPGVWPHVPI